MIRTTRPQNLSRPTLFGDQRLAIGATAALLVLGVLAFGLWRLPQGQTVGTSAAEIQARAQLQEAPWPQSLTRSAYGATRDTTVEVVFAPPEYFQLTGAGKEAARFRADENLVFFITEESHVGLASLAPSPILRFLGSEFAPTAVTELVTSPHHRATAVTFRRAGSLAHVQHLEGTLELVVAPELGERAAQATVQWQVPLALPQARQAGGFGLSWAALLGLFGGLLTSMWPCLFQLTAYFIPSLAGLSMAQAGQGGAAQVRRQVLKTAFFFVLGIVVVYTLAGAVAGYAAQSLAGSSLFETWRRPITVVAALFITVMAVRVAVRARAPLVCKMPLLDHLGGKGPTGAVGTMATGLAFATGCMTCFGSAMALGMLTYVVSSASVMTGALTMFLFSLGIAIPLVVGAIAMAQVLPLLGRLERVAPGMALASSVIMVSFAVLLVSDQYHLVSDWMLRVAGL